MKVLFKHPDSKKSTLIQFSKDISLAKLQGFEFLQKNRDKTGGRLGEMLNTLKECGVDHQVLKVGVDHSTPLDYAFTYTLSHGKR
jgi:hypothetical protein